MKEHRVLVCGSRDFTDYKVLAVCMWSLMPKPTLIIHGNMRGVDKLAEQWAKVANIRTMAYPADWGKHGRAAGPIRNALMLQESKPHLVVAFPGGRGTASMIALAEKAGVPVKRELIGSRI